MKIFKKLVYNRYSIILVLNGSFKSTELNRPYARIFNVLEAVSIYDDAYYEDHIITCTDKEKGDAYDIETRYINEIVDSSLEEYKSVCRRIKRKKYFRLCRTLNHMRERERYEKLKSKAERKRTKEM